jgi:predicted unusual protein kinase regulating ubiquinone biosynthesis (AarF/ABC1/UbiB family)
MLVPKVLKQFTRKRVLTMEWVDGENPKDLLSLSKGVSEKNTQASDKQKLEAKSRLLDLVFTNDLNKPLSTSQYFPLGKILK